MMMNRHRSTSRSARRESESRQPEEDGRRSNTNRLNLLGNSNNGNNQNPPRTPRSTASTSNSTVASAMVVTPGATGAPSHSAPPAPSAHPKTRCYRLNLEKPFDIRQQKSPLGRDYSGPPVHDSDLPPAQGPVEYFAPVHLASKEEMNWRRHSWGGAPAHNSMGGASTPSELMACLHVSISEESTNEASDPTTIAISTARIFRGIVVDRNGVITSMNSRAMRSQRGKNGENKNKTGEKSRQAAKIDKAKDLIDEMDGGGGGGMSDEENDPTKIVSLFVMGEYEDLDDLVRDGSKKLRDSKSLTDETVLMYNRPRQFPPGMHPSQIQQQQLQSPSNNNMVLSQTNSPYSPASTTSPQPHYSGAGTVSPTNTALSNASSPSNLRKRVFSADKSRSRYKQVPRSAPPKLKSHPRDTRSSSRSTSASGVGGGGAGATSPTTASSHHGYHRGNSNVSHHTPQQTQGGMHGGMLCNPTTPTTNTGANENKQSSSQPHHYFPQQCNFFPGNSDWTEALGFSVNSLWNCGANGGHMSPTMSPHQSTSPRNSHGGGNGGPVHAPTTGGGVYHGSGAAATSGYHPSNNYHHPTGATGGGGGYNAGGGAGYNNYSTGGGGSPYRGDEGRNPSSGGYGGYGRTGTGVRDTVVM
mmetsp:Transcript_12180/g.21706  ORF Transcript_12180/g.21706 Transcript_12180/m.21706 type:complete len:641 (+) Transcript_12180:267-2189(+)|eukprot:CAMPEP_0201880248 /NCGR_PEP_ID=MMETSP0902-20130614/10892_1 /ASSEMBLY_ACC=CAM_ASM_000551 /TAXON_ID=420261 /ORGANISM="Thalassiosira antarctica, Strain CCMP982" /LENGTH=640 /DNA_ID=CAMNT_0048408231 /DNA_START=267 /DNA_END=2189 /DNA_ORIENTATION=-